MNKVMHTLGMVLISIGIIVLIRGIGDDDGGTAPIFIGVIIAVLGGKIVQKYTRILQGKGPTPANKGKPAPYTTKRCQNEACEATIPLAADFCPECCKKQKENAPTCCGGINSAAEARSYFADERRRAKSAGCTQYTWRSTKDGAVCERCANNDGHIFSYDEEPEGGHAGARAKCRCYPEPIL